MEEVEKLLNAAGFETVRLDRADVREAPIWGCKIGLKSGKFATLPGGADAPMRQAVEEAFLRITGQEADFCFSGWGEKLTKFEADVVEDRS